MNWRMKIATKLVLSRLRVRYRLWRRLGIFVHGDMDVPQRAFDVCGKHFGRAGGVKGKVILELGPGDSVFSGLIAHAMGAAQTYQVDVGDFATRDVEAYKNMLEFLKSAGYEIDADVLEESSLEAILSRCNSTYLTEGLRAVRALETNSVDFIWSHTVLQHVFLDEFESMVRETRRILKKGGVCSHQIDLKDMLGGRLNNLRFSDRVWESRLFRNSGFYTNRLRYSELIDVFRRCGFEPEIVSKTTFDSLPTPKKCMQSKFRKLADEDLLVSGFTLILRDGFCR